MKGMNYRQEVERRIVAQVVDDALAAGYRLAVSLDRGYDTDTMLLGSRDRERIMAEATAGDEAHIFIQDAEGPLLEDGQVCSVGWVFLVFGNDGWDVISDYTTNLEKLLANANHLSDALAR